MTHFIFKIIDDSTETVNELLDTLVEMLSTEELLIKSSFNG
jgi:hypothetical protein